MKIKLDEKALRTKMAEQMIISFRELCDRSGIVYSTFIGGRYHGSKFSVETYWLLADCLGCHVEDLQIPDWSK